MVFLLVNKKRSVQATLIKAGLALLAVIGVITIIILSFLDSKTWTSLSESDSILLMPVSNLIHRAKYMFDEPKTFADSGIFEPNSIINYLDLFSSERLSIIKCCEERFFTGNPSDVIQVGTYFAYNAHNAYVQILYEYGYIAGSAFILCLLTNTVAGMHQYIKTIKVLSAFDGFLLFAFLCRKSLAFVCRTTDVMAGQQNHKRHIDE